MKRITIAAIFSIVAFTVASVGAGQQNGSGARAERRPASSPVALIYPYCDPRELVRLVGVLVGEPDRIMTADQVYCTTTRLVCDLQIQARNVAAQADLMARLAEMSKVCRAAGY